MKLREKAYILKDTKEKEEGLRDQIVEKIERKYSTKNIELTIKSLDDLKVKSCIGCYECWFNEYGYCPINDDFNEINKAFLEYDYVFLIIRITYGMQSHKMKNLIDRKISEMKPLSKFEGENWDRKTVNDYNNRLFIIGYSETVTSKETEIFKKVLEENIKKYKNIKSRIYVINLQEKIDGVLGEIFEG